MTSASTPTRAVPVPPATGVDNAEVLAIADGRPRLGLLALQAVSSRRTSAFSALNERSIEGKVRPMAQRIVTSSPDILSGTPVFAGTRVPVQALIDYLEGGETIDDFLAGFPTVKRDQVVAFLEEATARMISKAS
jgi:uncharacterized protein (DUF433 family)